MERRPYFVLGDLLSCTVTGAAAALVVARLVSPAWSPWLAMPVGMVLGMLVALPVSLIFVVPFGFMEVLLPGMLVGMLAGMWAGMEMSMEVAIESSTKVGGFIPILPRLAAPANLHGAAAGALIGVGVMILVYAMNARLTRRAL